MASRRRLNKPCPCGSGDRYGDCCAPQNHRKKRRRRRKDRRDSEPDSSQPTDPLDIHYQRVRHIQPHYSRFIDTFAAIFNSTFESLETQLGVPPPALTLEELEVFPDNGEVTHGQLMLTYSWTLYRNPEIFGLSSSSLRKEVAPNVGADALSVVDVMDDAAFGAWRVHIEPDSSRVTAIDGRERPHQAKALATIDNNWYPLDEDGIFVGWLAEIAGEDVLFFGHPLTAPSESRLLEAAEHSAWGRSDQFRTADYEADMLALILSSELELSDDEGGRVFIEDLPTEPITAILPPVIVESLATRIWFYGLAENPPDTPGTWSSQAARAIEEDFDDLIRCLRRYLDEALERDWWLGAEDKEYIRDHICDRELATLIHIEPTGGVDHPAARRWASYPVGVLDLDSSLVRQMGLQLEWSIDHALRWGRQNLDESELQILEDAATKHRIAMRWVGIVSLNDDAEDFLVSQIQIQDLSVGIRDFFPDWAAQTPLEELHDRGRGTWARLTRALRDSERLDVDAPLLIENLPESYEALEAIPGVGSTTIRNTWLAILDYVMHWPDVAGYHPTKKDDHASQEALSELEAGLDDLDELF